MTFTTLTFLIFLALVFSLYWGLRKRAAQNLLLLVGSYVFYGWWDYRLCGLILASSLVDYAVGRYLERTERPGVRRALLGASLACNLGLLGTFKYFNFFADNLVALASSLGFHVEPVTLRLILPVGISFYTFQTLSYTIDIYRRKLRHTDHFIDYLAYVAFFPQLVAGPIERASRLLPQFLNARSFDYEKARDGALGILWGFFKKLVLADNLGVIVNHYYAAPGSTTGPELAFATVCFAFQIYCDFSAYSDIAIGVGRLFGFELMRNFAYPYFSQNLAEFWHRWHISLSTWFRDYVYIPLGGNRVSKLRRAVNVLITFVVSGFWHGAAWNYVIWGGIHGLAVLPSIFSKKPVLRATDVPGGERLLPPVRTAAKMAATFVVTCLAWVFFRAATFGDAVQILGRIFGDALRGAAYAPLWHAVRAEYSRYVWLVLAFVAVEWLQRRYDHPLHLQRWPRLLRWFVYVVLWWLTLYWSAETGADFIYFQF